MLRVSPGRERAPLFASCPQVGKVALPLLAGITLVGLGLALAGIGGGVSGFTSVISFASYGVGGASTLVGIALLAYACGKRKSASPPPPPKAEPPLSTKKQKASPSSATAFFQAQGFQEVPTPHTRKGYVVKEEDMEPLRAGSVAVRDGIQDPDCTKPQFSDQNIRDWFIGGSPLFSTKGERIDAPGFSQLKEADRAAMPRPYAPSTCFEDVPLFCDPNHPLDGRVGFYRGSLDSLQLRDRTLRAAVATSNDGDLRGCCGYALAKCIHLAAGPVVQRALYNCLGVPGGMSWPEYAEYYKGQIGEGRGYAVTAYAGAMEAVSGIQTVEVMTVPWGSAESVRTNPALYRGVVQMYYEALVHSADKAYLALPLAGATHPLLSEGGRREAPRADLNARLAMQAVKAFYEDYPSSRLKVLFVVWDPDKSKEATYATHYYEAWRAIATASQSPRPSTKVDKHPPTLQERTVAFLWQHLEEIKTQVRETPPNLNDPIASDAFVCEKGFSDLPAFRESQRRAVLTVLEEKEEIARAFLRTCVKSASPHLGEDLEKNKGYAIGWILLLRDHFFPPTYFDIPGCKGRLYYSGQLSAANRDFIRDEQIHTVCNMAGLYSDVPSANFFEEEETMTVHYRTYENRDRAVGLNFSQFYQEVYGLLREGKRVLIHCLEGRNRSALALMSILLRSGFVERGATAAEEVEAARVAAGTKGKDSAGNDSFRFAAPHRENIPLFTSWWEEARKGRDDPTVAEVVQELSEMSLFLSIPQREADAVAFLRRHTAAFRDPSLGPSDVGFVEKIDLETQKKIFVRADLHGDWGTLVGNLQDLQREGWIDEQFRCRPECHIFVLGDFVNRGPSSWYTLYLLLLLRQENPSQVHLIRGNHESAELNQVMDDGDHFLPALAEAEAGLLKDLYRTFPLSILVSAPFTPGVTYREYVQMTHGGCSLTTDLLPLLQDPAPVARRSIPKQEPLSGRVVALAQVDSSLGKAARSVKDFAERYFRFLGGLALQPEMALREQEVSAYTWADIGEEARAGAMTEHCYFLTPRLIEAYYHVNADCAHRIVMMLRGHQHVGESYTTSTSSTTLLVHTLPVAVGADYVVPGYTASMVERHIDHAYFLETAPRVQEWTKSVLCTSRQGLVQKTAPSPLTTRDALPILEAAQ